MENNHPLYFFLYTNDNIFYSTIPSHYILSLLTFFLFFFLYLLPFFSSFFLFSSLFIFFPFFLFFPRPRFLFLPLNSLSIFLFLSLASEFETPSSPPSLYPALSVSLLPGGSTPASTLRLLLLSTRSLHWPPSSSGRAGDLRRRGTGVLLLAWHPLNLEQQRRRGIELHQAESSSAVQALPARCGELEALPSLSLTAPSVGP